MKLKANKASGLYKHKKPYQQQLKELNTVYLTQNMQWKLTNILQH
jgi:hypothetical protein